MLILVNELLFLHQSGLRTHKLCDRVTIYRYGTCAHFGEKDVMDIKIGFSDSPRELAFSTDTPKEELQARISEVLATESGTLELHDERGRTFLVKGSRIAYVELGSTATRPVGFIG